MAIGDEALRLKAAGAMPFELDLGQAWQELTGLPFVFGVWARAPGLCRGSAPKPPPPCTGCCSGPGIWGLRSLPELSRIAGPSFSMTPAQILAYFHQLNYSLDPEHEEGLATFFNYLYNLGEIAEEPRLEYFGRSSTQAAVSGL